MCFVVFMCCYMLLKKFNYLLVAICFCKNSTICLLLYVCKSKSTTVCVCVLLCSCRHSTTCVSLCVMFIKAQW
jgi:hypothetical protein